MFANILTVSGCISECLQPTELKWGTHENNKPATARQHLIGDRVAIHLDQPGGSTIVKSWVLIDPQPAFLITHNESIALADYYSLYDDNTNELIFWPTKPLCLSSLRCNS